MQKFCKGVCRVLLLFLSLFFLVCVFFIAFTGKTAFFSEIMLQFTAPIMQTISQVQQQWQAVQQASDDYAVLRIETEQLRIENALLQQKLYNTESILDENTRLRALHGITERLEEYELESAEVIARNIDAWSATLTLDKGSSAGAEVGDLVLNSDGIVGFISVCTSNYCEITTILDPQFSLGAIDAQTREVAVLQGNNMLLAQGKLELILLPSNAQIAVGDQIESAGAGENFPKGMPVGTVESISLSSDGLTKTAVIVPFCNINTAGYVYILKDFTVIS